MLTRLCRLQVEQLVAIIGNVFSLKEIVRSVGSSFSIVSVILIYNII